MSDCWDDDDYDPNEHLKAQLSEKIVTLGLENAKRTVVEGPERLNNEGEKDVKGAGGSKTSALSAAELRELSEQQKREAQLSSDAAAAADLFGLASDKDRKFDDLQKKEEFEKYAEILGEQISNRADNAHYLSFVNTLVDALTKPMKKTQLETIEKTVQDHLAVYRKKDAEEQSKVVEQKQVKTKKKETKKKLMEDSIVDEYDDYTTYEDKYF